MRGGAGTPQGRGPLAGRPLIPQGAPRSVGSLLSSHRYAVPPSRGWVESTAIDRSNPYAAFLRANREVLAGNAPHGAGLSRVEAANEAEGEEAGVTRDQAHRAAMADPAYVPPGHARPGGAGSRLMANRDTPFPIYAPSSANRRREP